MNLSQLRIAIDRRTGVAQAVTAANGYINESISEISNRREWPWLTGLQTITITSDETYPVNTDYSETRTMNVGGVEAELIYIADGDEFNSFFTAPRSYGYEYTIESTDGLTYHQFFPQPPVGTTVKHRYVRSEGLLSADSDTPFMPERYHYIIADLASSKFLERISPTRAQFYRDLAEKGIKQMGEAVQRKSNPGRIRIREEWSWI